MACEEAIQAWRPTLGGALSFKPPRDGHHWTKIQVPCGTCILCRKEQARQWAMRITHEAAQHEENCFLTLTYDNDHLPDDGGLRYRDLTLFWKRLRKHIGRLRYYAVGEYGDKSLRPHYHACLFGHAFTENRIYIRDGDKPLWTTQQLIDTWQQGHVSVGALNYGTASYTASYIHKKLNKKQQYVKVDETTGELIRLEQPRAFMSRGGRDGKGIASGWIEQWKRYTYDHDHVVMNGTPGKPAKYYDQKLKKENEPLFNEIKKERMKNQQKQTEEQLRARARNAHAHAKLRTGVC